MRTQRLVLKGFELWRDEALGVFERLAAPVVVGHLVDLALGDFDKEAVHPVVLHPQVGNAGAGFFAALQAQQKAVAVGLDGAQLVQLGVKAVGNHAAVAHQRGWLGRDGLQQQLGRAGRRRQLRRNLSQIGLQPLQHGHHALCFL